MIKQLISTMLFVVGVVLGEKFSTRSFGIPKRHMFLLEIIFFVAISVYLMNVALISREFLAYPSSFVFGIVSITLARGMSSLLGSSSSRIRKNIGLETNTDSVVYGIIRELKIRKFNGDDIIRILKRAGVKGKKAENMVEKYLKKQ